MYSIVKFRTEPFIVALKGFFEELKVPLNYFDELPAKPQDILGNLFKVDNLTYQLIDEVYVLGLVNDSILNKNLVIEEEKWTTEKIKSFNIDYPGLLIIGVTLRNQTYTRSQLAEISRVFNRVFKHTPVTIIFKYGEFISFANTERVKYIPEWREGEKVGKVTMLKDIDIVKPHAAHLKILSGLTINIQKVDSFAKLYHYWQTQFSLQALNEQFYKDLQDWFYYALKNIKLPYKPDYIDEKENNKNFLVQLLSRIMFCWFVKEKGLIKPELLELTDWEGNRFLLTNDITDESFLQNNSYYRGVLQNMFYYALNQKDKKNIRDFRWIKYLHPDFQIEWFTHIPYLNGGIFEKQDDLNSKESIDDSVIRIPNYLFYGIEKEETVTKSKGKKAKQVIEKVEHKGLNGILKSYKFTLDENTPFEEDIALDPEMLGLVFENLLAELDPNLEESTISSIRKQTGSYYTPRKVIFEMVNDCLYLYLSKFISTNFPQISEVKQKVKELVYSNHVDLNNKIFCQAIVRGLDKFKMLDPACGSGAFPLGMLHRMVDLLKLVDKDNQLWLDLVINKVDIANRIDFKKVLNQHLDDYSRKLGIIRDCIYGIDIQPLAVQITKLRFFISLLIDQNTEKGITPMPNIETKIICADSLKNIHVDLFSSDTIEKLTEARMKYYQPEISHEERDAIANEIVEILNIIFPTFAYQITGKKKSEQNVELLKAWFKHSTIAAPFFNMNFFFPELIPVGGFDCVIGNPPYGGTKISDEVQKALSLESKDPYGAFIARFLNAPQVLTPLKNGGVLAFIVSDTFMTIKSHLKLRKVLIQNYIHKMLRMNPDTFRATVNTVIMVAERNTLRSIIDNHICLMGDLTNISIHDNYDHFVEILDQTRGVDFENLYLQKEVSNEEYALYYYPQSLIRTNTNLPFFVASPKLFKLMNDCNDSNSNLKTENLSFGQKQLPVRTIELNENDVQIVKLSDIAEVKQGLATGDNNAYIFQNPDARGTYRSILEYQEFLLTEEDLEKIRTNNALRLSIIDNGINKDNPKSERYFKGRYIIPYDKGGESDANGGWMPNYYVPTNYFIDWSEWALDRMKKYTIAQRIREYQENKIIKPSYEYTPCAVFRSPDKYFNESISFSRTGVYSPTFRIGSASTFDTEGSMVFQNYQSDEILIGLLTSKLTRFLCKNYIGHTVHTQVDELKEIAILIKIDSKIENLVLNIIQTQKTNLQYDYASHEQVEIDRLIYNAYGLNAEDILEVENWYVRRYSSLSVAQKANLRALGKSDNYLKLYGLK